MVKNKSTVIQAAPRLNPNNNNEAKNKKESNDNINTDNRNIIYHI